ncbi:calcium-binding protein [Pseudomonas lijiangensis]|uniref:calcium-binding protein n=1 Tax=Pseudomonas lijiangensis TaxID=2995658 RepID=UPI0034D97EE2
MTEPLDLKDNYTGGDYIYEMGGDGFTVVDGKKQIDCSHMVNLLLKGAGYNIPYENTSAMSNSTYYTAVLPQDVKPGDIALWINVKSLKGNKTLFHTGIVESFDYTKNAGYFFGAQTSTGPAKAVFGPKPPSYYWPVATKFLRAKEEFRTGTTPAPAAAPPPTPAPAGPAPLMNFHYPFRKADGKQFTDAEEIYKALEGETSGHYLLGNNRFWHGGIHISDKSAPQCVLNEPVRCMADGEVVAYRLNQDYLESTFGDNEKKLKYSNSFCLVRHEYKSAPNPEEGPNKGKQNKLNFYSLYMHLLPYARYPLAPEETPKPVVTMNVGDYKAYDKARWAEGAQSYGLIKKGTRLEIIDQASEGVEVYAKGKILVGSVKSGSSTTRNVGDEIWFAYKKNDAPYKNSGGDKIWTADKLVERLRPNYWQGKVKATAAIKLDLYKDPANPQNGQPAGDKYSIQLNATSIVEFESKEVLTLNVGGKLRRMAKCTYVSGEVAGAGTIPPSFWICVENEADYKVVEWTSLTPGSFDSVETASTGIKAGDPIGYLGLTENLTGEEGGVSSKHQVHVEIFTAEAEVKEFLKNVAGLKTGKQYLYLAKDAKLKIKASATETPALKKEHAIDLAKAPVIKEDDKDWYEVSVVDDNQTLTGLVKKTGAQLITQHDWEKLGFQIVEESNPTADGFLDPDDMPPFFKDLFAKIDKNNDKEVSSDELSEALKNKDTRDQWSKLIACHPKEWRDKSGSAKWSKLDTLLETSPKTLKHEKERIDKYVFWDELSGKAAIGSSLVWHFHPVGFLDNVQALSDENDLKWLKVERGQLTFDVEGNDLEDPADPLHMYFSRKVHWPGGASGITIGRGYDLGQRPNPESDLAAVGIVEPLLGWLIGSKGLSGNEAKNYLANASDEIKKIFITRKQQYQLFTSVYEVKKNQVISISGATFNVANYGSLNWDGINQKIQDMMVDLIYRGDYTPASRIKVQRPFVENNMAELKSVMSNQNNWPNVPSDRFIKRSNYL